MQYNLYVTDWAPNGTNDLLVCDSDHQIVHVIESATFGIDVCRGAFDLEKAIIADCDSVFPVDSETAREWINAESIPSEFTVVEQIDLNTLKLKLTCSPIDPNGSEVLKQLKKIGIDLIGE
jgi:hypothetical protein